MEDQLKEIISPFLRKEPSSLQHNTVIDRSALGNSIAVHRMYAKVLEAGFAINDYSNIKTFGDLLTKLTGNEVSAAPASAVTLADNVTSAVGIDMEDVNNFELAEDYREHHFYKNNFTPLEISYCLLQPDPRVSFAGLFAAKEAIIKADNNHKGSPFTTIEIDHDKHGKPYYKNFSIAISHTANTAIAVAFINPPGPSPEIGNSLPIAPAAPVVNKNKSYGLLALVLAFAGLLLSLFLLLFKS